MAIGSQECSYKETSSHPHHPPSTHPGRSSTTNYPSPHASRYVWVRGALTGAGGAGSSDWLRVCGEL